MIATRDNLTVEPVEIADPNCETVWVKISTKNNGSMYVGSFYRRPNEYTPTQLESLEGVLQQVTDTARNDSSTIILGGDFNAKDIDWDSHTPKQDSAMKPLCLKLLSTLSEFSLSHHVREPTREHSVLDLFCSNKPGLVKSVNTVPGVSDHDVVVADCDIRARFTRKVPGKSTSIPKPIGTNYALKHRNFRNNF